MRLLFAVVHYFKPGNGRHGSLAADPQPRIDALRQLILQTHRLYGQPAAVLNHRERRVDGVEDGGGLIDLRVCVRGDCHVLDHLDDVKDLFQPVACEAEDPRWLGFAAQKVLVEAYQQAELAGQPYDYISYLEDDIILYDFDFFLKLRLFNCTFGNQYLLMPNRIETIESQGQLRRFYIDGNYNPSASVQYRQSIDARFSISHLGELVKFEQPSNLHSGCFFLNRDQAHRFAESGHAGVVDDSFHGPLESAATLGMLKTFQLMKPAPESGRFLTVEHGGRNFMGLVPSLPHG
jgi:hypothetical protein